MAEAAAWWRREGFLLAVDDVGSGQSRVLALAEAVPDFVKVDRPLLVRALESGAGRSVLLHLASLARSLGARLVAEGVESGEELALVRVAGFDLVQGYLLGPPGPLPGA
jgi:EAL domain-containing protein (putative c-di-GMP-specific phosphodiesterase class I)